MVGRRLQFKLNLKRFKVTYKGDVYAMFNKNKIVYLSEIEVFFG